MSNELVEQRAREDAQKICGANSRDHGVGTMRDEITAAIGELNPADYNQYLNSLRSQFQPNSPMLGAIDLYDSALARPEQKTLQAITANDDQLYRVLDTYNRDHNGNKNKNETADGKIGAQDIEAFLKDAKEAGSEAQRFAQANPGLTEALQALKGRNGELSKTSLLNALGYDDKSSDKDNSTLEQFKKDHSGSRGAVTFNDLQGRPEVIVEPNGSSSFVAYDSNGNSSIQRN